MPVEIGLGLSPVLPDGRPGTPFVPSDLGLRAWYDAELGQPKNVGYVQLDGTSGDYITTPDSAALSFSNDIEIVMRVYCNDWTAAASQTLCGKYVTTSNQRSFRFYVSTAGAVVLTASADGTAVVSDSITPSSALTDATWVWLRMRLDLTNGSNSVATLETAADNGSNGTEPSSWTANGTQTGTALAGIFDSTSPLEIGTFQNGTSERFSGRVGRCIVRSGFAGTTVADFNADDCYGPGYTGSLGNVWTLGLPKIYDRSGNGVAPATFGAGSNQPRWLPWLGVSCVHLESAAAGTNSISCTAPAGAASYVARSRDYPNVADATGAASAGAFTFTTAGQWQYISILDGSAVEIARFVAASCSQTGMTDGYSVAWTVNRGTAGRKAVVQSPVANTARSVILHGTDDYIDVPVAAIPPLAAASLATVGIVCRQHTTPTSFGRIFSIAGGASERMQVTHYTTGTFTWNVLFDGTTAKQGPGPALPLGSRSVRSLSINGRTTFTDNLNAGQTTLDVSTVGDVTGVTGARIAAAASSASSFQDIEFEALALRAALTSSSEHGQLTAYYRGGL